MPPGGLFLMMTVMKPPAHKKYLKKMTNKKLNTLKICTDFCQLFLK